MIARRLKALEKEEMGALAAQVSDEQFRKRLLDLAAQYEKLCDKRINRGLKKSQ